MAFKGWAPGLTALSQNRCAGLLADDSMINSLLTDKAKWGNFEMTLPTIFGNPWGIAVRLEDKDGPFGKFISGMIYEWHRSGKILALEKKWGIGPTDYVVEMHKKHKDWLAE